MMLSSTDSPLVFSEKSFKSFYHYVVMEARLDAISEQF